MKKIIEYNGKESKRIATFAKQEFPHLSRPFILELIESNKILVNGKKIKKGIKLRKGDKVEFASIPEPKDLVLRANDQIPLNLVYADEFILAFDKPRGLPTHPNSFRETETLANGIIAKFPGLKEIGEKKLESGLLNRLDNDTSGLVLVARTNEAYAKFKEMFAKKEIYKEYTALSIGHPEQKGFINYPLKHSPKNRKKMVALKNMKSIDSLKLLEALTHYLVIRRFAKFSLLKISLSSAVTHQIRVHLAAIGHPVAGDSLYETEEQRREYKIDLKGQFLHASAIKFLHPFLQKIVSIRVDLPIELKNLLESLD